MDIPSFMRLALIVFKLSKDPDVLADRLTELQTDRLTDGRTEGKPIVPSGVTSDILRKYKHGKFWDLGR